MAKINDTVTYPITAPTLDDTLIGTNTSGGRTKNFEVDAILGLAVPTGGTTGQVLAKASGTDFATEWANPSGGVTDHGALTGLADNDHPQYSLLASANTFTLGPNLFKAGADGNVALSVRRHSSGATANIFEAQNESGTHVAYIDKAGRASLGAGVETFYAYDATNASDINLYSFRSVSSDLSTYSDFLESIAGLFVTSLNEPGSGQAAGAFIYGLSGQAKVLDGSKTPYELDGLFFAAQHLSTTNTVTNANGAYIFTKLFGPTTTGSGVFSQMALNAAVGDAALFRGSISGASNAATLYGVYLPSMVGAATAYSMYTAGGETRHLTGAAATVGLSVQAAVSQSADLLRLLDSDGSTILHRYNKGGYWVTSRHSAPADGDLSAGDLALWFDQTNGAAKLKIKAKQADGTVRTGEVALT